MKMFPQQENSCIVLTEREGWCGARRWAARGFRAARVLKAGVARMSWQRAIWDWADPRLIILAEAISSLGWRVNQNIRQTPLTGIKRRRKVRVQQEVRVIHRHSCFMQLDLRSLGAKTRREKRRRAAILWQLSLGSSHFFIQRARREPDEIECARSGSQKSVIAKRCSPFAHPEKLIQSNLKKANSARSRK